MLNYQRVPFFPFVCFLLILRGCRLSTREVDSRPINTTESMLLECHQGGTGSKGHEQAQATALGHDLGFNLLPACERELELFSRMKHTVGS